VPLPFDVTRGDQVQEALRPYLEGPEAIDIVVISHCHGDHVNGLLTADGKPAVTKAGSKGPAD
jgi:metal-dependent hydrolase (beta-lactamase superfamily II)